MPVMLDFNLLKKVKHIELLHKLQNALPGVTSATDTFGPITDTFKEKTSLSESLQLPWWKKISFLMKNFKDGIRITSSTFLQSKPYSFKKKEKRIFCNTSSYWRIEKNRQKRTFLINNTVNKIKIQYLTKLLTVSHNLVGRKDIRCSNHVYMISATTSVT